MAKLTLAAATQFAHLLGRGRPAAGTARADEDKDPEDEKERRDAGRAEDGDKESEDGEDQERKQDGKRAGRAEDGDKESEDDGDQERKQDGKRAGRAEDGDDEDEEDDADPKTRAARRGERARCAAIFSSPHAGTRPDMAAHLAFKTSMTRGQALEMLAAVAGGEGRRSALGARMAGMETLRPGADAPARGGKQAVAGSWDAAAARAGITPRK